MRLPLLGLLALIAACGGSSSPPDGGGSDASTDAAHDLGGDAGPHDAGTDAPLADGGDAGPGDAGPPDGGDFDLSMPDLGIDAGFDAAGDPCGFVATLDTTCTTDTDCAYGIHQTDCCGNTHAEGFAATESSTFPALEAACDASYPGCGCPAHPTTTDSGETALDPTSIQVACVARGPRNVCLTYVTMRPPDSP